MGHSRCVCALSACAFLTHTAMGQSFGLDDNPLTPIWSPPGIIPGCGAEYPLGLASGPFFGPYAALIPPGLAPSPSLTPVVIPGLVNGDGDILLPGPVMQLPSPGGWYISSFSQNTPDLFGQPIHLQFSVDRAALGALGTVVRQQANFNQAPADIFRSSTLFKDPAGFVGTLAFNAGYVGLLPSVVLSAPTNTLLFDDSFFGLGFGSPIPFTLPPTVAAPAMGLMMHDNIDSWENRMMGSAAAPTFFAKFSYFTVYPDVAMAAGISAADIIDVAAGSSGGVLTPPYAFATQMGLQPFDPVGLGDAIDALVVFDCGPFGGPANNGPGAQAAIDYALFSLAPGSISLAQNGLEPGDVFFTDFTGSFATFASSMQLGLFTTPGIVTQPGSSDNIDALDFQCGVDLNGDGVIDGADLAILLNAWGPCVNCPQDLNGDGFVDGADLAVVLNAWGPCG